jgi:hypothetical protein
LETPVPSSADLAGDPAIVARAEALRLMVEAASTRSRKSACRRPLDKLHGRG